MSRIIFETKDKSAEVRGSERFYMAYVTSKLTEVFLDIDVNRDLIRKALPANHYLQYGDPASKFWAEDARNALSSGNLPLIVNGESINAWHLVLNTATAVGSDAMKLAVRIHAQCEIHAYAKGENRAWLAGIIEEGLGEIFREDSGWESVITLLREDDDEPVVMSYSVTDGFRESGYSEWLSKRLKELDVDLEDEAENGETYGYRLEEEWCELDSSETWKLALEWLEDEERAGRKLEITPQAWPIYFGNGLTASKLISHLRNV